MRIESWGRGKERDTRDFFEKAYRRQSLAPWDAKWHELSVQARYFFLNVVKGPSKKATEVGNPYSVAAEKFPPHMLEELSAAGFIEIRPARSAAFTDRVIAPAELYDFATRVRALHRMHLLSADKPSEFQKYVDYAFIGVPLRGALSDVLLSASILELLRLDEILERYVIRHDWPDWAAKALKDPLADRILAEVQKAAIPVPIVELAGRFKGVNPEKVRSVLDQLVARLALIEDLAPETWDVVVGFLPKVREARLRASQPRERPSLLACERPKEVGPSGGVIVNDLRAVLLEIVSEPPLLRQDQALFQKEVERFTAVLEPVPAWFHQVLKGSDESRVNQAFAWGNSLHLIEGMLDGKKTRLHLTTTGQKWLSSGVEEQYHLVYGFLGRLAGHNEIYSPHQSWFFRGLDPFSSLGAGDMRFLGEHVTVLKVAQGKRAPYYWDARPEDYLALRQSLDQALSVLEPGRFYRLDSVELHLAFREFNPLNRGLTPDQVAVFWHQRLIPPLEEQREEAGRLLIEQFVRRRLIPVGSVRVAIDDENRICIARGPGYDSYFGRKVVRTDLSPTSESADRVVVQPDFSVIVIGLNPTSAVELAPFCERATQGGGQGALVLKITRESVVKAVSHGLKPAEILDRLKRHASNGVPANVLRELEEWANWVRHVTTSTLTVLRCPNRDTADRVMGALKNRGERLNPTLIAIEPKSLNASERNKLRTHGIIVEGDTAAPEKKARAKSRRRR